MGRSGLAAKKYLERKGLNPQEIVTFDAKSETADYRDPALMMSEVRPSVLVVSPGVPLSLPWIQEAQASGVRITSEISLACEALTSEKVIGVTGSVGKSTTVALLGAGATAFDPHAFVGGNFGVPFCEYAVDLLSGVRPKATWIILELSSFQLENCEGLSLNLGAITSLTANHLERYRDQEHYYETKGRLRNHCRGPIFLNRAGGDLEGWAATHPGHWVLTDPSSSLLAPHDLGSAKLIGRHNQENLALAASLALAAGWPKESLTAMKAFPGLAHRLEDAGTLRGVRYINDSKATALSSVLIATHSVLGTLQEKNDLFLLLGGRDKNLPWKELSELASHQQIHFLFFGECGAIAQSASGLSGPVFPHLKEALEHARNKAKAGDAVLLSPGGTSLDEFKNFEHRGDYFKEFVQSS
ncbi:MAG: UDP-N-acetylmuramoyl-L-alanine--D-glutamate ligase [Bdellovibrionaceae bacterium]|nr:UDP-N-acetylmuramoyl-L-alanine--D-glutamate ligase [Pseudobdellovibrionaceae bacterium]